MTVLPAVVAAFAILGAAAPAVPPVGPGSGLVITDPSAGSVHLLTPGVVTQWSIGVTTTATRLDSLRIRVTVPDGYHRELVRHLSFSVRGCTAAWVGHRCPTNALQLAPMTAAVDWTDRLIPVVLADGSAPGKLDLMLGVTLDEAVGRQAQGDATRIRVQVLAAGDQADSAGVGADLPNTGFRLLRALLTGVAAVVSGIFLAGLGRRRTRVRPS